MMNKSNSLVKFSRNGFFNKLLGYFIKGLLLIIPFWSTIYLLSAALKRIDSLIKINFPGLGFIIILVSITIIGYIGSNFIVKSLIDSIDKFTLKIPLINLIYSSLKDLTSAFVSNKRKFNSPVLIIMNKNPLVKKLGFITEKDLSNLGLKDMVAVYVPNTYSISGDLYIVNKNEVTPLEISSTEAMKFAVSGGITTVKKE